MKKQVAINSFVKRQTKESRFSHFEGSWDELEFIVEESIRRDRMTPDAHVKGAYHVSVPPNDFYSGVVKVTPENKDELGLKVDLVRRLDNEDYYLDIVALNASQKEPAVVVDVIIYSHDALAADNDAETNRPFEIISINAKAVGGDELPSPITMARNFLHLPGGTQGEYSAKEFAESIIYWSTRVMIADKKR